MTLNNRSTSIQEKRTTTLVTFRYGDQAFPPTVLGWCDDAQALSLNRVNYAPEPRMEVKLPNMGGTLDTGQAWVELPLTAGEFTDQVSDGLPFPETEVTIEELQAGSAQRDSGGTTETESHTLFVGTMARVRRHPQSRWNRVRIYVDSPLAVLRRATSGVHGTTHCEHTLYGEGCEVDALNFRTLQARVTAINGTKATIVDVPGTIKSKPAGWFVRGTYLFAGMAVFIRDWQTGTNEFVLARQLPEWVKKKDAVLLAGCDRTYPTCRDRFGNKIRFGGYGIGTPAYNPQLEVPS